MVSHPSTVEAHSQQYNRKHTGQKESTQEDKDLRGKTLLHLMMETSMGQRKSFYYQGKNRRLQSAWQWATRERARSPFSLNASKAFTFIQLSPHLHETD